MNDKATIFVSLKRHVANTAAVRLLTHFRRDQRGVLALPMIFFLLAMLAVGGIGMDLVRLERDRTELQYTLDRAVLAAADLDQPLEPEAVVEDYLSKAGLGEYYSKPYAEVTPTSRKVSATIDAQFDPYWMRFAGYEDALPLKAASTAEESIGEVEISLVLDVSGSMGSNSRLTNLKTAAKEFVETMDANTEEGKMSISIVPYSTQVSMPAAFIEQLNAEAPDDEDYSYCINFTASDYSTTDISLTTPYERTMHFSPWGWSDYRTNSSLVGTAICAAHSDNPERTSLLFENDVQTLKDYIDAFSPSENTSIDIGMKWGVALLDPSVQPIISALTANGIAAGFADRPVAYSDSDTLKVVVLMTDGQNTGQYYVEEDYREGSSNFWYNSEKNKYSTYNPSNGMYYWHYSSTYDSGPTGWYDHPYGNGSYEKKSCSGWSCTTKTVDEPGEADELTYASLFADTDLKYAYDTLRDWMGNSSASNWYYSVFDSVGTSAKNTRTRAVCQAAKDQGIMVFTIGFEAPAGGQTVLRDCASSDSHYYDVEGLEISDAFASIASAIRQLRLTE